MATIDRALAELAAAGAAAVDAHTGRWTLRPAGSCDRLLTLVPAVVRRSPIGCGPTTDQRPCEAADSRVLSGSWTPLGASILRNQQRSGTIGVAAVGFRTATPRLFRPVQSCPYEQVNSLHPSAAVQLNNARLRG
jgi:hypothetical protein